MQTGVKSFFLSSTVLETHRLKASNLKFKWLLLWPLLFQNIPDTQYASFGWPLTKLITNKNVTSWRLHSSTFKNIDNLSSANREFKAVQTIHFYIWFSALKRCWTRQSAGSADFATTPRGLSAMILYLSVKQRDINILIAAPNGNPKHNEGKKRAERKRRLKKKKKRSPKKKIFLFITRGLRRNYLCISSLKTHASPSFLLVKSLRHFFISALAGFRFAFSSRTPVARLRI